jgi:hypothetical protein
MIARILSAGRTGVDRAALVAALALLLTLSFASAQSPFTKSARTIRAEDFRNFTYLVFCILSRNGQPATVRVHKGSFYGHVFGGDDAHDFLDFTIEQVAFGD